MWRRKNSFHLFIYLLFCFVFIYTTLNIYIYIYIILLYMCIYIDIIFLKYFFYYKNKNNSGIRFFIYKRKERGVEAVKKGGRGGEGNKNNLFVTSIIIIKKRDVIVFIYNQICFCLFIIICMNKRISKFYFILFFPFIKSFIFSIK